MATQKVSLTQKYLPKEVWNWLSKKTSHGTTIYDCVVSGTVISVDSFISIINI